MSVRIIVGDCRHVLRSLPADHFHTVVTSPPYWGLRDYEIGQSGIGLEPTLEEHIDNLVEVFAEVRRVLRDDGTVWLNYGDAYSPQGAGRQGEHGAMADRTVSKHRGGRRVRSHLKPKDLMMMPARVALALQADGWWLRSKIIWHKPNPMPESVTDRPTSSYEEMFLMSKRATYFYDAEAVREAAEYGRRSEFRSERYKGGNAMRGNADAGTNTVGGSDPESGRNLRNVWTIATHAYSDVHFATFPPALVEPCIKAGTSERGACADCGAPWRRCVEKTGNTNRRDGDWEPTCACGRSDVRSCEVLDPFGGAGTVGMVAQRLNRDATMIELNADYASMARNRIHDDAPLLADVRMGAQALKEEE